MINVVEKKLLEEVNRNDWNNLVEKTRASVFQSFEWNSLWWKHFGEGPPKAGVFRRVSKLKIMEGYDGDRLVGVGPFYEVNGVLNLLGGEDITDYEDVICLTDYRREFIENIKNYKYDFRFVPEDGNLMALAEAKKEVEEVAPEVELPSNFEDYINNLERHNRQELRRKMRKLERGMWKLEKAKDGEDIDDFIRLHKTSDRNKEKFMTVKMESFFRDIARVFFDLGRLDLSYLVVDGKRVASTFSFKEKDRILAYNAGFDVNYGYLSVGLLAHAYAIKGAINPPSHKASEGVKIYDFLRGNEKYKYQLGAKDKKLYRIKNF